MTATGTEANSIHPIDHYSTAMCLLSKLVADAMHCKDMNSAQQRLSSQKTGMLHATK